MPLLWHLSYSALDIVICFFQNNVSMSSICAPFYKKCFQYPHCNVFWILQEMNYRNKKAIIVLITLFKTLMSPTESIS